MERKATQKSCHLWGSVLVEDLLQSLAKVSIFLHLLFIPCHTLFEFKPFLNANRVPLQNEALLSGLRMCQNTARSKSHLTVRVRKVFANPRSTLQLV